MQKVNSETNNNKATVKTTTTTQNGGNPSKSPKISSPNKSSLSFKITNGSIGGGGVGSTSTHSLIKLRKQALVSIKSKCEYFFQTAESPNIGS